MRGVLSGADGRLEGKIALLVARVATAFFNVGRLAPPLGVLSGVLRGRPLQRPSTFMGFYLPRLYRDSSGLI